MAEKAIDPVCGMKVDPATAKYKLEHGGKVYYFCAEGCKRKFEKDPTKYMKEGRRH
ncbi:MAG: YHS domain-containing protein [Aigarchaeota archaeon]|nr:YHS domain-containing protein [Candidatus Pelearchaeum maunauluense]